MDGEFISLADLLRGRAATPPAETAAPEAAAATAAPAVPMVVDADDDGAAGKPDDVGDALRDARLFRARLADAFAASAARLVRDLAADVLVRELRLAPCEIAVLVHRALERAPVIRVRVAPSDVERVHAIPVIADPALREGDAIVELAGGLLDARLGVRLVTVLEAFG